MIIRLYQMNLIYLIYHVSKDDCSMYIGNHVLKLPQSSLRLAVGGGGLGVNREK